MARIVGLLGAQIEHQSALVHESDGLHGGERGKGLEALPYLIDRDHDRHEGGAAREIGVMADEFEKSLHSAQTLRFFGGASIAAAHQEYSDGLPAGCQACMLAVLGAHTPT